MVVSVRRRIADIARAEPDGFATVGDHGRLDPDEVEAALRDHPAVIDAAAPHPQNGAAPP